MYCLRSSWFFVAGRFITVVAFTMVLSGPARGQTVGAITAANVTWEPKHKTSELPFVASYQNCVDDDAFVFKVRVPDWTEAEELLVFGNIENPDIDCSDKSQRTEDDSASCVEMARVPRSPASFDVEVYVRQLIAVTSAEGCAEKGYNAEPVNLYFLLVDSTNNLASDTSYKTFDDITIDLVGPSAPTNLKAGSGENKLILSWSPPSDTELQGFRFFCDPPRGQASLGTTSYRSLANGEGGAGGASPAALSTEPMGKAGSGGEGDGSASTSDADTNNCGTDAFHAGDILEDSAYACGSVNSATATTANTTSLTNDTEYAVAAASVDSAGNVGPLSNVACETPRPVDDFFEVYRRAGGQGGGGFCALGARSTSGSFGVTLLGALIAWQLRRRRGQLS